jgi:hypothetical protein
MRLADIARETAACVAAPRCYDRIYHTVDPTLVDLTPEEVKAGQLKLRDLKAWRRAEGGTPAPAAAPASPPATR